MGMTYLLGSGTGCPNVAGVARGGLPPLCCCYCVLKQVLRAGSAIMSHVWECMRPECKILLSGPLCNDMHGNFTSEHGKARERVCI